MLTDLPSMVVTMCRSRLLVQLVSLLISVVMVSQTLAIDDQAPQENDFRDFVLLTLGVNKDLKIPENLEPFDLGGDFRRVAKAAFVKKDNLIRMTPTREGIAILTLLDKKTKKVLFEYRLTVAKSNLDVVANEIRDLLGDIEGVQIKIRNNKVIIDGQIILTKDMNRIVAVRQQYDDLAVNLVTISPVAQRKLAEIIAREINNPEVSVRAVNDRIILEGTVNSEDEKNKAEIVAKTYLPGLFVDAAEKDQTIRRARPANEGVVNLIVIRAAPAPPPPKTIQVVVHYVELSRDYNRAFRFQWLPEVADSSSLSLSDRNRDPASSSATGAVTATISNLLPRLNWARSHGFARVLESSTMIVQDGKEGILNSQTKVPYTTLSTGGANPVAGTGFEPVGVVLNVSPLIQGERSDTVNMNVELEVSALLQMTSAGPVVSRNKIVTEVGVRSGQSAAIGGLIKNRTGMNYNRLPPGASANPILSLYASRDFARGQSQFVIFVTPIIKSSSSAGSEKIKQKFRLRE